MVFRLYELLGNLSDGLSSFIRMSYTRKRVVQGQVFKLCSFGVLPVYVCVC